MTDASIDSRHGGGATQRPVSVSRILDQKNCQKLEEL